MRLGSRSMFIAAVGWAVGLVLAGAALADAIQVHYTAADQAAARAELVRIADLGAGWKGGARKPDVSSDLGCTSYNPKQSDLVVTGAAAAEFTFTGLDIRSEAHVLRTAKMVVLDWQRTVVAPQVMPCLRQAASKDRDPQAKFVSLNKLAFPRITSRTAAFRALVDVTGGGTTVRVLIDIVAIGKGRSELTLTTTAPYAARASVQPAEVRLARIMAARAVA